MNEYFIRITPYGQSELNAIDEIVRSFNPVSYCLSREIATRVHYHLYFKTDYTKERLRYQLKSKLNAQIYISGKDVQDKIKTIAYTIKDGDYTHMGLDVSTFLMAQSISFQKVTFDSELKELYSIEWGDSPDKLAGVVLELYCKYNRKIYEQHIVALVKLIMAKQSGKFQQRILDNVIRQIHNI